MKKLFTLFLFGLYWTQLLAQDICPVSLAPAPRLFHIQRTGSPDTIVYDANTTPDGLFHKETPVRIYWKRAPKGKVDELNYLQRTKGYGVKVIPANQANEFIFHLVSYSKRNIYLKKDDCGQPVAVLTMAGKEAYLQRMFIQMEPGLKPTVHYIELFGVDVQTGYAVYEKVIP